MFSTLLLLALVTQAPAWAPLPPIPEITVDYDKFEDRTAVVLHLGTFDDERGRFSAVMVAVHSGKGRPAEPADEIHLGIGRYGIGREFADRHEIRIACGDDRLKHTGDKYGSEQNGPFWWNETLYTILDRADLKKQLAKNENVEVKIGDSKPIPFMASARNKMRIYIDYIEKYPSGK